MNAVFNIKYSVNAALNVSSKNRSGWHELWALSVVDVHTKLELQQTVCTQWTGEWETIKISTLQKKDIPQYWGHLSINANSTVWVSSTYSYDTHVLPLSLNAHTHTFRLGAFSSARQMPQDLIVESQTVHCQRLFSLISCTVSTTCWTHDRRHSGSKSHISVEEFHQSRSLRFWKCMIRAHVCWTDYNANGVIQWGLLVPMAISLCTIQSVAPGQLNVP